MKHVERISGPQGASSSPSQSGDTVLVEPMATGKLDEGSTVGTPVKTTVGVSVELQKAGATSLTDAPEDADKSNEQHEQGPPKSPAGDDTEGSYSATVLNINGAGTVSFYIPGSDTGDKNNGEHKSMAIVTSS